jgi:two-component system osmolarity sensor histidine kinase EnvZ
MVDLYAGLPPGVDDPKLHAIAARFHMDVESLPPGPLPPNMPQTFFNVLDPLTRALPEEIGAQVRLPFWVDTVGRSGLMEIRVNLGGRVLRFITRRSLAYEPNVHIFILWMLGASLVLVTVAILFLRNQIRPILRLAEAAEDFGKGRDAEFHPRGAREVRQAGYAFVEMKRRIERASEQRTAMLNGVSHDLRTMLTRFKLSLAVIGDESVEVEAMQKDVDEMQRMLEAYLAFARGDAGEATEPTDLRGILDGLRADAERHGARVEIEAKGDLSVRVRPLAIKRCLGNLVANAERHAQTIAIRAAREQRFVTICVDDDGPGIAPEHREDVFRPFHRLDEARNQDEGGSGLGLAIARDVARSHGGEITLSTSPLGGLRASVRLPI